MNFQKVPEGRPLRMAVIGAGNRANKYLEYARRHPERLQPVAVVDGNELRRNETAERFGLASERRYADYDAFFARPADADAVLITTPDDVHFDPCMKAIDAGLHVLLEKPIAQRLDECRAIVRRARERGVLVGICHVLRYHPYFAKIREIVDSGELGQIISVNHVAAVGIDRTTHSYVRGPWRREETSNPMLLAKCCHDVDFLLWITRSPCRKLSSFGSLRWFRAANAPQTSAERCIDCPVEHDCPYSAVDLYCTRRDWISNFDVPQGRTLDEVLTYEVDRILIVLPSELQALAAEEGKDLCTLVTCTPYGVNDHRLLVHCVRTKYSKKDVDKQKSLAGRHWGKREFAVLIVVVAIVLLLLDIVIHAVRKRRKAKASA